MINYILPLILVVDLLIFGVLTLKFWKKKQPVQAIICIVIGLFSAAFTGWFIMDRGAESTPISTNDPTAEASRQYINNLDPSPIPGHAQEASNYSEENKKANREAVERFKSLSK